MRAVVTIRGLATSRLYIFLSGLIIFNNEHALFELSAKIIFFKLPALKNVELRLIFLPDSVEHGIETFALAGGNRVLE